MQVDVIFDMIEVIGLLVVVWQWMNCMIVVRKNMTKREVSDRCTIDISSKRSHPQYI
jgi:hypothetical protein